jgi:nucleotide-binding universal stress UspA family protein
MKTVEARTRIQLENVLFLTDFSNAAGAAIPFATEFAKRFGAKLYALHVQTPVVNPLTEPATWAVLEKAAEAETKKQRETLLKSFPGMKPEVIIEEGGLWSILAAVVEKNKIDLIVLGTRGRGGVGKFFLGSAAEEIFRQASCAVLTVGPFSNAEPPRDGDIAEILYATDFSSESAAAASYAISLAQEFQAHLTLLHVIAEPKTGDLVLPEELAKASAQRLRNLVPPEAELWCEPRFMVETGPAAERILEIAKRRDADLIVLGVHRPTGFPGAATHLPIATAHKIVTHAPCPVLTVRGGSDQTGRKDVDE